MEIERNTFYRRQQVSTSGAVKLSAMYKDLSQAESEMFVLGGGTKASRYVISGQSAPTPKYGNSELTYGTFSVYVSGADLSETAKLPSVDIYALKKGNKIQEGSMSISTSGAGGETPMVIASWVDSSIPWIEENFDGSDKNLGEIFISAGGSAGSTITYQNPYVLATQAASQTFAGGGSFLNFGEDIDGPQLMQKYFSETGKVGENEIPVRPLNKSKINGFWIPQFDHRTGLKKATVFRPIWKMRDLKGILNFKRSTASPAEVEGAQTVNTNNTIFNSFAQTVNLQTAYTSGPDTVTPWCLTTMELSNEFVDSGGQALKMYGLWGYNSGTCHNATTGVSSEEEFGPKGGVNAQFCRATITGIPYPAIIDQGAACTYLGSTYQDSRISLPEINIKFAINKMDRAVRMINRGDYAGGGAAGEYGYHEARGICRGYGGRNTFQSTSTAVTLGRSFTVTLSNYPPAQGENLDEYITRMGYRGSSARPEDAIIGGFTCLRLFDMDNAEYPAALTDTDISEFETGQAFTVMPLQSDNSAWAENSAVTITGADEAVNIAATFSLLTTAASGAGNASTANTANCIGITAAPSYRTQANVTSGSSFEKCLQLSMGKFINAKIVFDPLNVNYRDRDVGGETDYMQPESRPFCRVFFTEGTDPTTERAGVITETPYVDLYFTIAGADDMDADDNNDSYSWFPMAGGGNSKGDMVGGDQKRGLWPSCLSIWMQNYRYVKAGELRYTTDLDDGLPVWGYEADFPEPNADGQGVARETEVYVDSITLNNWNNEMLNCSSLAASATSLMPLRENPIFTPNGPAISTTTGRLSDTFKPAYTPTNICIGFEGTSPEDPLTTGTAEQKLAARSGGVSDFPLTNLTVTDNPDIEAYLLMNGFSSQGFSGLVRQAADAGLYTQMYVSTAEGSLDLTTACPGINALGQWGMNASRCDTFEATVPDRTNVFGTVGNANYVCRALESTDDLMAPAATGTSNMGFGLGTGTTGTGSLSTDGLTQKGTLQFFLGAHSATSDSVRLPYGYEGNDVADTLTAYWTRRENPLCAARITGVPSFDSTDERSSLGTNAIIVDNPAIFDMPLDSTSYVIYQYGYDASDIDNYGQIKGLITGGWPGNSVDYGAAPEVARGYDGDGGFTAPDTIKQIRPREGNIIFLDADPPLAETVSSLVTDNKLPYLFISPKKYWINLTMYPGNKEYSEQSGSNSTGKTYDGMCILSASGEAGDAQDYASQTGSTYNEWKYFYDKTATAAGRKAIYPNSWLLDPEEDSNIETSIDFGHGAWDTETNSGGMLDYKTAYENRAMEFNVTPAISGMELSDDDDIYLTMQMRTPMQEQTITMYGNDWTGSATGDDLNWSQYEQDVVKPQFIWGYKDELPMVSSFKVNPLINPLEPDINLYELTSEALNTVQFTWEEEADDIWYRMLYIDNKPIDDKYHGALLHFPFNDTPQSLGDDYQISTTGPKYYSGAGLTTTGNVTRTILPADSGSTIMTDIQGFQGYGQMFSGSVSGNLYSITGLPSALSGTSEATFMTHLIPFDNNVDGGGPATTNQFIWTIDAANTEATFLYMDSNNRFNFSVSGVAMTSRNIFDVDGERPIAVVVTFNADRAFDNWKMYINGVLEDTSAGDWDQGDNWEFDATEEMAFGCSGADASEGRDVTHMYKGFIEEVVIFNKEYYLPAEENKFNFDTSYLVDAGTVYDTFPSGAADNMHTARLFLYDRHNIRGSSPKEVARTNSISWKVTSV